MIYYAIIAAFIHGSAVGWALTWAWYKDVRTENKRLRARKGESDEKII